MMKIRLLAGLATLVFPFVVCAEDWQIEDNFDAYPVGELELGASWSTSVSGVPSSIVWQTSERSGKQEIVEGEIGDRKGKFFAYSENEERQAYTYSYLTFTSPYADSKDWSLSVDFYIESLEEPAVYGLIALADGSVRGGDYLMGVACSRNSVTDKIQISVSQQGGSIFLRGNIELHTWYRLTITGNNSNQTFDVTVEGPNYGQSAGGLSYAKDTHQFDTVLIGDVIPNKWQPGRNNLTYLDKLELHTKK